jgi:RNA polymerase sigma-70 factor (ECF subfamily)
MAPTYAREKHLSLEIFVKGSNVNPGSSLPSSTSTSLIARLRANDRDGWVCLANLYGPLVYGWCRRRGLQAEDAADVAQEVFRAVARHIQDFKATPQTPSGSFRGWLWTITRNKILDHHRRAQRRPEALGGSAAQERMMQIPEALDDSEPGSSS